MFWYSKAVVDTFIQKLHASSRNRRRQYRVDAINHMPQGKGSGNYHCREYVKTLKLMCILQSFNTQWTLEVAVILYRTRYGPLNSWFCLWCQNLPVIQFPCEIDHNAKEMLVQMPHVINNIKDSYMKPRESDPKFCYLRLVCLPTLNCIN